MTQQSHVTTPERLTADLQASLVKDALESSGICVQRQAERTAHLCVALFDPNSYDAAVWKAAEALYAFMESRADLEPLITRSVATRAAFLTMAVQAIASFRLTLEGGFPSDRMLQAVADYSTHREQLAARRALRAVGGR